MYTSAKLINHKVLHYSYLSVNMYVPSHRITSTHNTHVRQKVEEIVKESNMQYRSDDVKRTLAEMHVILQNAVKAHKYIHVSVPFLAESPSGAVTCLYKNIRRQYREAQYEKLDQRDKQSKRRRIRSRQNRVRLMYNNTQLHCNNITLNFRSTSGDQNRSFNKRGLCGNHSK